MHINLMSTLVEFFDPLRHDVARMISGSQFETASHHAHAVAAKDALNDVVKHGGAFIGALTQFSNDGSDLRRPEKVRSATTNLIRAVEMFKKHYACISPESGVRNHHKVGCLYGYAEPRTATLDKAALVAQETMIDVWTLPPDDLQLLVIESATYFEILTRTVEILADLCVYEESFDAVA